MGRRQLVGKVSIQVGVSLLHHGHQALVQRAHVFRELFVGLLLVPSDEVRDQRGKALLQQGHCSPPPLLDLIALLLQAHQQTRLEATGVRLWWLRLLVRGLLAHVWWW